MLTTRYHIGSIIAIFLALGIGILIGGTLGQRWMYQTEKSIVEMLMDKYEDQISANQLLQKQIGSLQLMNQTVSPIFNHKKILWIRPQSEKNDILSLTMRSVGADWYEKNSEMLVHNPVLDSDLNLPDIIMISDPGVSDQFSSHVTQWNASGKAYMPKVVDVSSEQFELKEPQDIVNFILYLKKILEEESHAAIGYYRYTGLE